jgi:hypothetical protein
MEHRGINELIRSGRSLRNRCVQKVNSRLQIRTLVVVRHDVECRRVKKSEEDSENVIKGCEMSSNHEGVFIGW